jgi:hypothetical protein
LLDRVAFLVDSKLMASTRRAFVRLHVSIPFFPMLPHRSAQGAFVLVHSRLQ